MGTDVDIFTTVADGLSWRQQPSASRRRGCADETKSRRPLMRELWQELRLATAVLVGGAALSAAATSLPILINIDLLGIDVPDGSGVVLLPSVVAPMAMVVVLFVVRCTELVYRSHAARRRARASSAPRPTSPKV